MKVTKSNRWRVMVLENHEIAGETFTDKVWVHCCQSLTAAITWAEAKWGQDYPKGAHIVDAKDGQVYYMDMLTF